MNKVTKEQARDIYNLYSQIEDTETLIRELKEQMEKEKGTPAKLLRDNDYHPHGSITINVPYFGSGSFDKSKGSRIYIISYPSAIKVLKNHIKQLKRELNSIQSKIAEL